MATIDLKIVKKKNESKGKYKVKLEVNGENILKKNSKANLEDEEGLVLGLDINGENVKLRNFLLKKE